MGTFFRSKKAKKPPRKTTSPKKPVKEIMKDIICASCGAKNRPEVNFCEDCGKELVKHETAAERVCPNCDAKVRSRVEFCEDCGKKLH